MSLIKLIEIRSSSRQYDPTSSSVKSEYSLKSIYLNTRYVVFLKENLQLSRESAKAPLVYGLEKGVFFTQLALQAPGQAPMMVNVVGSPEQVIDKLQDPK